MNRASSLVLLAPALALACRGPNLPASEDEGFGVTTRSDAGDESDTGAGDTDTGGEACPAWPEAPAALGRGETTQLWLSDATAAAGLDGLAYFEGAWPAGCDPEGGGVVTAPCKMILQGAGAAVGDFDDDGWPDLYVTRLGARDLLFRNLGASVGEGEEISFEEVGASLGLLEATFDGNGAVWVDVDNDDDLDLYVTSFGESARFWFYRNRLAETGTADFVEEAQLRGLAMDDGEPHWGFSIAVGDYDRDGWLDLYTSEWRPGLAIDASTSHARLLRNRGGDDPELAGHFEDRTEAAGVSMIMQNPPGLYAFAPAFVDLDEDRWPDLAITSDNGTSRLFWNQGDGSFVDGTPAAGVSLEKNGMGSCFADLDGDGHLDWYVTAIFSPNDDTDCGNPVCGNGGNRLYRSFSPRCFEELGEDWGVHVGGWGWGASAWDPDNDGDLDLVEVNGFHVPHGPPGTFFDGDPARLWRNGSEFLGETGFAERSLEAGLVDTGQGRGLIVFDYDRDGDQDLLILDNGPNTRLWRNHSVEAEAAANAWLDVELRRGLGAGNRRGVGARLELRAQPDGPLRVRVIGVGGHFLGQGENRAHFGLGPLPADATLAELRVIWPEGGETVVEDLPARQTLVLDGP